MNLRRLGLVAMAATLLTLAVGVGGAGAHNVSFGSRVTIDDGGPKGAEGHVSSGQSRCVRGRLVTLYVVDLMSGELLEIDAVLSDADGDWEVDEDLFAGEYVAEVDPKSVKMHGKRHRCRGDRSLRMHL